MLSCSYSFDDADGDPDTSRIEWFRNSNSLGTSATLTGSFSKDQTITCEVTPNDGTLDGSPVSAAMTINNAVPGIGSVTIEAITNADGDNDPSTATATDTLECLYTYFDEDGDSDNSTLKWRVNGTLVGTSSTLAGVFTSNDEVKCTVTPNDGIADGNNANDTILIQNLSPITIAEITATTDNDGDGDDFTAGGDDDLRCSYTYSDPEGDAEVGAEVTWEVNGVAVDRSYVDVGVGLLYSCAVSGAGVIECWGETTSTSGFDYGQVTDAPTDANYVAIDAAYRNLCALTTTGEVDCWGISDGTSQDYGQVSDQPRGSDYVAVDTRYEVACALSQNGEITCWGDNTHGQAVAPSGDGYSSLSTGAYNACAIDSAGQIQCWGITGGVAGDFGQVTSAPTGTNYVAVAAGTFHTCALTTSGAIECWGISTGGTDDFGQVTDAPIDSGYVALASGNYHVCAVDAADQVVCWGQDDDGESTPPNLPGLTNIDGDLHHNCALDADGAIHCWGRDDGSANDYGQVTDIPDPFVLPSQYFTPGDTVSCTVSATDGFTSGSGSSGSLVITDTNTTPAISGATVYATTDTDGDGNPSTIVEGDTLLCDYTFTDADGDADASIVEWAINGTPLDRTFVDVQGGDRFGCGLTVAGYIECWGAEDGSGSDYGQVSQAPTGGGYTAIALGLFHACALDANNALECWGIQDGSANDFGQVTSAPIGDTFASLQPGFFTQCATDSSDNFTCWGYDSTSIVTQAPTSASGVIDTTIGNYSACFIDSVGGLDCWGADKYGELADHPTIDGFVTISSGRYHMCALGSSGALACWGRIAAVVPTLARSPTPRSVLVSPSMPRGATTTAHSTPSAK